MITTERSLHSSRLVTVSLFILLFGLQAFALAQSDPKQILVRVNGRSITQGDLDFFFLSRGVSKKRQQADKKTYIERLIDQQLMRAFLNKLKVNVDQKVVELRIGRIHNLIKKQGDKPEEILEKLGMTEERLQDEIVLPIAWNIHFLRMVPEDSIRQYFKKYRSHFDGTEVRASQIRLKIPANAESKKKEELKSELNQIRGMISSGKMTFVNAAKKHSQAASRHEGGDLGFFPYRGKMPRAISDIAFSLKEGEMSQPFETPFGMHLLLVTKIKPGELSLEDARKAVLRQYSNEKWIEVVRDLRSKAKIQRFSY